MDEVGDPAKPEICISIDVERDYRADRRMTVRGIAEGLPVYLDLLRSLQIPHDLFVSGEVAPDVPKEVFGVANGLVALGSHGLTHEPGVRSYLNRKRRPVIENERQKATQQILLRFGRTPLHFRAPNFSTSAQTLSVLERLGYRSDSSVLPGRYVRRWRTLPLLDHRNAPLDPYHPDPRSILQEGSSSILEVPVTPNPFHAGSPLGLGFLHDAGPLRIVERPCVIVFSCRRENGRAGRVHVPVVEFAAPSHALVRQQVIPHHLRTALGNRERDPG